MRAKTVSSALIALFVLTFSNLSWAQGKTAKATPDQAAKDAQVAALFSLVKALDQGRPLTHESIKKITKSEVEFYTVDHFMSAENPGCNPLIKFIHAHSKGNVELELRRPSGISLSDVKRVFGNWQSVQAPSSLTTGPAALAYVYERAKGWLTFECEKSKTQQLLVVTLTDK